MDPETILLLSLVVFLFSLDVYLMKKYRALSAAKRSATGITGGHLDALKKGIHEALPEVKAEAGTDENPEIIEAARQRAMPAKEDKTALHEGQSIVTVEAARQQVTPVSKAKAAPKRRKRRPAAR